MARFSIQRGELVNVEGVIAEMQILSPLSFRSRLKVPSSAPGPTTCTVRNSSSIVLFTEVINPGQRGVWHDDILIDTQYLTATAGDLVILYSGKPKYNGIFGKPSYLEFAEISSPTPIDFQIGDYVDYSRTGFRYSLNRLPSVTKSARNGTAGDAFVYKNVQFFAPTKDLETALFRDLVLEDNQVHFSSVPDVSTYENVEGIAARIQANLDTFFPGKWNIAVYEDVDESYTELINEVKEFTLSDGTCLDALNKIYELWKGIGWVYSVVLGVHTITIGRPNVQDSGNTTSEFSYGKGNGIKVLTKSDSTKADLATRVYAYGSDRNLPTRYYNNLSPAIKDNESVYIPHLMLPLSDWGITDSKRDASKAYLQAPSAVTNKLGIIPKILRFDGSGDKEEIYPSIKNITMGYLQEQGIDITGYDLEETVDEIKEVTNPTDDGRYAVSGTKVKFVPATIKTSQAYNSTQAAIPNQSAVTLAGYDTLLEYSAVELSEVGRVNLDLSVIEGELNFGGSPGAEADYRVFLPQLPNIVVDVWSASTKVYTKVIVPEWETNQKLVFSLPKVAFNATGYGLKVTFRCEMEFSKRETDDISVNLVMDSESVPIEVNYSISDTFNVTLKQLGFDISKMGSTLSDGLATIQMTTGKCAGRSFVVKSCVEGIGNDWNLVLRRQEDTSLSQWFPNSIYEIEEGDKFVITDMQMPDIYVTAAMSRLHDAATEALARLQKPKKVFVPEIDSLEVSRSNISLVEGLYVPVYDADLIETEVVSDPHTTWVLIDSVTIAEGDDAIPIYSITLRDEKAENMLQKLTYELNQSKKRLRDLENGNRPAVSPGNEEIDDANTGVVIDCNTDVFKVGTGGSVNPTLIVLTAKTTGLVNPSYQWKQKTGNSWVNISGATNQKLKVGSSAGTQGKDVYFTATKKEYKVVVSNSDIGYSYEKTIVLSRLTDGIDGTDGSDGSDGLMAMLTHNTYNFPGNATGAIIGNEDSVSIIVKRGSEDVSSFEFTYTLDSSASGKVSVSKSGASFDVETESAFSEGGKITITIYEIDGVSLGSESIDLDYNFGVTLKGADGTDGTDGEDGEDGADGENGYSNANLVLYQRFPTGTPSSKNVPNTTYDFEEDSLEPVSPATTLNGWEREVPSGDGPIYMTTAKVSTNDTSSPISITGGWTTANGDWSVPARLTGESGRMGKIMRGVNVWNDVVGSIDWQGINDTDPTHEFYDVVKHNNNYYYLDDCDYGNYEPGTASADGHWHIAENFDFIATKVLMARNAFIDIFSGNACYMYDNDGPSTGDVIAGMQGGSTEEGNLKVNFFAGHGTPASAPFRVYSDGSVVATKMGVAGSGNSTYGINISSGMAEAWSNNLTNRARLKYDGVEVFGQHSSYGTGAYYNNMRPEGIYLSEQLTQGRKNLAEFTTLGIKMYDSDGTAIKCSLNGGGVFAQDSTHQSTYGAEGASFADENGTTLVILDKDGLFVTSPSDITRDGESVVTTSSVDAIKHIWYGHKDELPLTRDNETIYFAYGYSGNTTKILIGNNEF